MKSLVIFAVLFIGATFAAPAEEVVVDKCNSEDVGECTRNMMRMSDSSVTVPSTVEEFSASCDIIKNGSKCVRNYFKQCASSNVRQMAKLISSGVARRINEGCSPSGIDEILKHRTCLVNSRSALKQCYKQSVMDIFTIKQADKKQWLSLMCCYASRTYDCGAVAVTRNCNEGSRAFFKKQTGEFVSEMTDAFCPAGLEWGSKACADISVDLKAPEMPKDGKHPSPLPVILELMKEFSVDTE